MVTAKPSSKAYELRKNVSNIYHISKKKSQLWLFCSANSLKQEVYFIEIRYCRIMFIKLPKSLPLFQEIILIHRKLWLDQLPNWRRYICLQNPQWGSSINPRESEFDSGSFTTLGYTKCRIQQILKKSDIVQFRMTHPFAANKTRGKWT